MLAVAKSYVAKGLSVIPVGRDKKPLLSSWKEYQTRRPTPEELEKWFSGDAGIAIVTGKISNLSVVDIDPKNGGTPRGLPPTLVAKTQSGGWHYYYRYLEGLPNKAGISDGIDIRSDGGYVVAPPTIGFKGSYEWRLIEEPQPFPADVLRVVYAQSGADWQQVAAGVTTGSRNETAAKFIGKLLQAFKPDEWESAVWLTVLNWNKANKPPLEDSELRAIFNSIAGRETRKKTEKTEDDAPVVLMSEAASKFADDISVSYSTGFEIVDETLKGGFREGDLVVVVGETGHGKRLHVDTPILTQKGWVRNGDIAVGDKIIGKNGRQTKVTGVHAHAIADSYEITFNDGTSVVADGEHLWTVQTKKQRYSTQNWQTLTTKEILSKKLFTKKSSEASYNWFLPLVDSVVFNKKKVLVSPFFLGVLLANGSFSSSIVNFTTNDGFIAKKVIHESKSFSIKEYICRSQTARRWHIKKFHPVLKTLGLDMLTSRNKYIPEAYLFSSVEQRLSLLQGLMDCDGHVVLGKRAQYYSMSVKLAEGVATLVRSLGGVAKVKKEKRKKGNNGYVVSLWTPMNPFSIPRKAKRYTPTPWFRAIKSIVPCGKNEMRCISVAASDGLYVIKDFIVTHNTALARTFTYNMLKENVTSVWFTFELTIPEMWEKFKEMGLENGAQVYTPERYVTRRLPWLKKKIIEARDSQKCKVVYIDHLGFLLGEYEGGTMNQNNMQGMTNNLATVYSMICRDLKAIAIQERVIIVLMWHLKKLQDSRKEPDASDIKDSSGILQECDLGLNVAREKLSTGKKGVTDGDIEDVFGPYTFVKMLKNRRTGDLKRFKCEYKGHRLMETSSAKAELQTQKDFDNF